MSYRKNTGKTIEEIRERVLKEMEDAKKTPLWRYMNETILRKQNTSQRLRS